MGKFAFEFCLIHRINVLIIEIWGILSNRDIIQMFKMIPGILTDLYLAKKIFLIYFPKPYSESHYHSFKKVPYLCKNVVKPKHTFPWCNVASLASHWIKVNERFNFCSPTSKRWFKSPQSKNPYLQHVCLLISNKKSGATYACNFLGNALHLSKWWPLHITFVDHNPHHFFQVQCTHMPNNANV